MTEAAERLKAEIAVLPEEDRAELAQFLIHSLDEGADEDAESDWDAELARRMEQITSGRSEGRPAGDLFRRLREKYP